MSINQLMSELYCNQLGKWLYTEHSTHVINKWAYTYNIIETNNFYGFVFYSLFSVGVSLKRTFTVSI